MLLINRLLFPNTDLHQSWLNCEAEVAIGVCSVASKVDHNGVLAFCLFIFFFYSLYVYLYYFLYWGFFTLYSFMFGLGFLYVYLLL
jgi:hypothetical protein